MKAEAYTLNRPKNELPAILPDFIAKSIEDIDFILLKDIGIEHLLLDLDLTLRKAWSRKLDTSSTQALLKIHDLQIFTSINLVTNNWRAGRFAELLGIPAFKPFRLGRKVIRKPNPLFFAYALQKLNTTPDKAVMIGDKIHFDIKGGNRAGLYTVLVNPLGKDYLYDRLLRTRMHENRLLDAARETAKKFHKS
ncbi:MAG: YqeG family HAD IIIA-type phosphatase [Candidatus Saccharimonadales bacterium]